VWRRSSRPGSVCRPADRAETLQPASETITLSRRNVREGPRPGKHTRLKPVARDKKTSLATGTSQVTEPSWKRGRVSTARKAFVAHTDIVLVVELVGILALKTFAISRPGSVRASSRPVKPRQAAGLAITPRTGFPRVDEPDADRPERQAVDEVCRCRRSDRSTQRLGALASPSLVFPHPSAHRREIARRGVHGSCARGRDRGPSRS